MLKFMIPRMDTQIKEYAHRKGIDWQRDKAQMLLMPQKQRMDLERLETQLKRSAERLAKLLADRKLMVVKSPIDWSGPTTASRSAAIRRFQQRRGNAPSP